MFKACSIYAVLAILLTGVASADWLEGGYVGSGGSSENEQYFGDPIFTSPAGSYLSSDPALREMQVSLDRPLTVGSVVSRPAASKKTATTAATASTKTAALTTNAAGRWSLALSEGKTIYLELYRSGSRIFGRGSMTQGQTTYGALASGTESGASVVVDVVPEIGTELYSIKFDLNRLHLSSAYTAYRAGAQPASGTVKAIRMP
jgi:hypothetical protein